ncbi:threonine--tRNA ligase [Ehrlichia chaffeensis str. Heartland]|uniref:Threonine--tRNA ligase n=1 Tax=Ehrlichia chaffeensis (strain ATCC CRL-10679 / Arkansas) TaxID=205920 RepID=SYT_EHRCR|nr:threonine--tRNA ligase [Ehrlichia chaffeensis]Q2GI92.1 RecName: Full=Threonine--tRNA ligase; AltName: Full=Threonyl-tRNA synthetase; Short=ThrRS [Ehrlichia chaffeensis str. Arkansas]ABD44575.1 threonyl-tRNA synthetase [Ehrlichia chaffeensis str. Arkansas]AHX03203.1 threonine--tRNA ligase [Ehrlichia chaffeensis str. Heartland]AHX06108.1 threonine--tRNA ligase [Ehrlichia chaffeensis str. Liberty]AHX07305.1 threonine--tRNA ligase [Ehrlichia chaffeensis str. Osceola]AHX08585.1 threonine--tRNA 
MINIHFSNNLCKQFHRGIKGHDIVNDLFPKLKNETIAAKVNGELYDLSREIIENCTFEVITINSEEGLEIIRHDTAHIMAQAVKEMFPDVQITIGPTIKDGFYYDFATNHNFSSDDLEIIEKKMIEIINKNESFIREVWSREEAIKFFSSIGEDYKVKIISNIPSNENITVYKQGSFTDLCRGPHAPSTKTSRAFKLTKVSGSYWQGNSNNERLQRIYGTAWRNEEELKLYLNNLIEAEKRDHRKIGRELELFHIQNEACGQIFWHTKGWTIYRIIENYIRKKLENNGYIEVKTPILLNKELWEKSGHWDKFRENMFLSEAEDKTLAIKPMNCPCHIQIFNSKIRSYRDLPIRMAEFGTCHRYEASGALHGLMRVRGFTQDDAHIFCTESQITSEALKFCNLLIEIYKDFGFTDILVKFSDRPKNRAGSDEIWDKAEAALKKSVEVANLSYVLNPGDGAFYGPKLEFTLKDAIGREWQCGTLQMDFVLPERLGAYYIGSDGKKHHPVMLHRAILGTFERFIGILIEHHSGKFPMWLAPIQLSILTISEDSINYANSLKIKAEEHNIRVELDTTNEKINYKIRNHIHKKVPVFWIVGKKEVEENSVSIRYLESNKQHVMPIDKALKTLLTCASI